MNPSLLVHLVDVAIRMVLFSQYASSPLLYLDSDVGSVANELIGLVEGTGCWCGC